MQDNTTALLEQISVDINYVARSSKILCRDINRIFERTSNQEQLDIFNSTGLINSLKSSIITQIKSHMNFISNNTSPEQKERFYAFFSNFFNPWTKYLALSKSAVDALIAKTSNESLAGHSLSALFEDSSDFISDLLHNLKALDSSLWFIYAKKTLESPALKANSAFERYMKVGEMTKDSPIINEIVAKLKDLEGDIVSNSFSYMAIIGPSYMGKSQTAFTLAQHFNVMYVNTFANAIGQMEATSTQEIYRYLERPSYFFLDSVQKDVEALKKENEIVDLSLSFLQECCSNVKFFTLGLFWACIELKRNVWTESTVEFFVNYRQLNQIVFESLTIKEFEKLMEENNVDRNDFLLFVDEFNTDLRNRIKLLRNFVRLAKIPCILASTDADIENMLGTSRNMGSRNDNPVPWVKVVRSLPKATVQSLSVAVKVGEEHTLFDCLDSQGVFFFAKLLDLIGIVLSADDLKALNAFIDFIFLQIATALPGLSVNVFQNLAKYLLEQEPASNSFDISQAWNFVFRGLYFQLRRRKPQLSYNSFEAMYPSLDIFKFLADSPNIISARYINHHLYYYGMNQNSNILDLFVYNTQLLLNNSNWDHYCYFPRFDQDVFAHLAVIGGFYEKEGFYGISFKHSCTVASIYSSHIARPDSSPEGHNDSNSQEQLANFCIANASHRSLIGKTPGMEMFCEFVGHLQVLPLHYFKSKTYSRVGQLLGIITVPRDLRRFLERVEVPFLSPMRFLDKDFVEQIRKFMRIGYVARLPVGRIFDIQFSLNLDGQRRPGYIECKYTDEPTGLATLLKYINGAIFYESPLTFVVVYNLADELKDLILEERIFPDESKLGKSEDEWKMGFRAGVVLETSKNPNFINLESLDYTMDPDPQAYWKPHDDSARNDECLIHDKSKRPRVEVDKVPRSEAGTPELQREAKAEAIKRIETAAKVEEEFDGEKGPLYDRFAKLMKKDFKLNIYSVSSEMRDTGNLVLAMHTLYESSPDPDGVLVVVQTTFKVGKL